MATPFTQAVTVNIAPEISKEREAGFKLNLVDQLTGTLAAFDIQRLNVPVITGAGIAVLSDQESKGYEADLIWQPNKNLKVLASYGHTDVVFSNSNMGVPQGNKVPGVPENSGRVSVNYTFDWPALSGWSAGAGVYAASSQYVNAANLYKTPGYYTVDAKIGYNLAALDGLVQHQKLDGREVLRALQLVRWPSATGRWAGLFRQGRIQILTLSSRRQEQANANHAAGPRHARGGIDRLGWKPAPCDRANNTPLIPNSTCRVSHCRGSVRRSWHSWRIPALLPLMSLGTIMLGNRDEYGDRGGRVWKDRNQALRRFNRC